MRTLEAIAQRRSIKHFQPNRAMPEQDVQQLLNAAQQAPTSFNIQHGRIIRVTDPALRIKLQEAAWGQAQVTEASELWALCADVDAWKKAPQRYWQSVDADKQQFIVDMLTDFYNGKAQLQRDEAIRSCGIIGQTIMLAAKDLGYDSCPMIGFDADAVADLIQLPEDHVVGMLIAIGTASESAWPRGGFIPQDEVVFENTF